MTDTITPSAGEPQKKRWKKWALWGLGGFFALMLLGSLAGDPDEEAEAAATTTTTETTTEATTTTKATTTTTEATTTTRQLTAEEQRYIAVLAMSVSFENSRDAIIGILEDDINVDSVDKFVFDVGEETVILAVTSGWASGDNQIDGAWELTRTIAELWHPDDGHFVQDQFTPNFLLSNSGTAYECDADFMKRLADSRASRGDWEVLCR